MLEQSHNPFLPKPTDEDEQALIVVGHYRNNDVIAGLFRDDSVGMVQADSVASALIRDPTFPHGNFEGKWLASPYMHISIPPALVDVGIYRCNGCRSSQVKLINVSNYLRGMLGDQTRENAPDLPSALTSTRIKAYVVIGHHLVNDVIKWVFKGTKQGRREALQCAKRAIEWPGMPYGEIGNGFVETSYRHIVVPLPLIEVGIYFCRGRFVEQVQLAQQCNPDGDLDDEIFRTDPKL